VFLIQRGLGVGVALYAPAIVLTVILGWPDRWTTLLMGTVVVLYTALGGIRAVTWTDFQQMLIMMAGLFLALFMAIHLLPDGVSFIDALSIAGAAGRLNAVTTNLDWSDRYNLWSGLIGGMFLALAYFGCDQSQVQRYLTGRSIAQSRISLLFNAVAKLPMQFFILLTGAMVLVFYVFEKPPLVFHQQELTRISARPEFAQVEREYDASFERRRAAAEALIAARLSRDPMRIHETGTQYSAAQKAFDELRKTGAALAGSEFNDTNYIFLTFVTRHLPAGLVGLILAAIFAAAMSTISAEVNSLATVSVVDIYRRFVHREGTDSHYLRASQLATLFWGMYAVVTAQFGRGLGSLIEAVNMLGSLFYGGLLGVFVLAFYFPRVTAAGAFWGVLVGEGAIFAAHFSGRFSFLWYNVIGCGVVIATGVLLSRFSRKP
jgi:Na+/proline symporter